LFEGGFMGHPYDARLIANESFQAAIATGKVDAIPRYRFAVGRTKGLGQKQTRIWAEFPTKSLDCGSLLPLSAMQPAASGASQGFIGLLPCQSRRARRKAALPRGYSL